MSLECPTAQICGTSINLMEALAGAIVKDANGCKFLKINLRTIAREDCESYTSILECGSSISAEEALKGILYLDDCGNIVLNVLALQV
jgi:hypothetical protein